MNFTPQTLLAGLVAFGVLIIVHELGHYLLAVWCGVKVERFSVGLGPVIFSRKFGRDQTEWAISAIPLGGYVKMLDARNRDPEDGEIPSHEVVREFTSQPVYKRMLILVAGPAANFLLAILIFTVLFMLGTEEPVARVRTVPSGTVAYQAGFRGGELITEIDGEPIRSWNEVRWALIPDVVAKRSAKIKVQTESSGIAPQVIEMPMQSVAADAIEGDFLADIGLGMVFGAAKIVQLVPGGAAAKAGMLAGDVVVSIDGKGVEDAKALRQMIAGAPGKKLNVRVIRDGRQLELVVTPQLTEIGHQKIGIIGIEFPPPPFVTVKERPVAALGRSMDRTWETSILQLKMIGKLLTGELSWNNVTGVISIVDYAGKAARNGLMSFVNFTAFISVSLGVMNLLPIPVLDGGFLLYYSLEVLTRRRFSARFAENLQRAGIGVLLTLMVVALRNDVIRLLH